MADQSVLFLDVGFHTKTRSSHFFRDRLAEVMSVETLHISDDDPRGAIQQAAESPHDLVVCWQTEFAAPYLLAHGKRVVCIPMYDAVSNAPDTYWLAMRGARFINFTERLHKRHTELQLDSHRVHYFGGDPNPPQAKFPVPRALFWQRRPEQGLDYRFAQALLQGTAARLHIHNAPDTEPAEAWEPHDEDITVSHFSDDAGGYRAALDGANLYICPRRTEGIGLTLVEAMARGMCVVANDDSSANEYIVHGETGLLIDYDAPGPLTAEASGGLTLPLVAKLGAAARKAYEEGAKHWHEELEAAPGLVAAAPLPEAAEADRAYAALYLEACATVLTDNALFQEDNRQLQALKQLKGNHMPVPASLDELPDTAVLNFLEYCRLNVLRAHGQLLQDLFVLWLLDGKQDGVFLDVGAADGTFTSNTVNLEYLGWKGLLVEPNPVYSDKLASRTSQVITRAIWHTSGETVALRHVPHCPELSKLDSLPDDMHDASGARDGAQNIAVETIDAATLFRENGLPAQIDYLSLDIEGCELTFLEALNLDEQRFGCATIEHNHGPSREAVNALMVAHGYVRVFEALSGVDDWFVDRQLWEGKIASLVPLHRRKSGQVATLDYLKHANQVVAQPAIDQAGQLLARGANKDAIVLLGPWLDALPENADLNYMMACAHNANEKPEKAVPFAVRALSANPEHEGYRLKLGEVLTGSGAFESALDALRPLLVGAGATPLGHLFAARALRAALDLDGAERLLDRAIEKWPDHLQLPTLKNERATLG